MLFSVLSPEIFDDDDPPRINPLSEVKPIDITSSHSVPPIVFCQSISWALTHEGMVTASEESDDEIHNLCM
jgi:hypothetical protein